MKLKKVVIKNYKSIGEDNNSLIVDSINTIIGKNESGKTNIIEALSGLNLTGSNNDSLFKKRNRINNKYPSFELVLDPLPKEKRKLPKLSTINLSILSYNNIIYTGGFSHYIEKDRKFNEALEIINNSGFRITDETLNKYYHMLVASLNESKSKIFINSSYYQNIIDRIKTSSLNNSEEIANSIKYCIAFLNNLNELFPKFFFVDNNGLQSSYDKTQIKNRHNIEMLETLLDSCGMSIDNIMDYWNTDDIVERQQILNEINKEIEKSIVEPFNDFYKQEKIKFWASIENEVLSFILTTTDTYLSFSERSEGLKWYFNMFIKMTEMDINNSNVIFLMDEPGIKLHVNAQKELLNFFVDLSKKDNQIIYSTHSPFMIFLNDYSYIRPIIKNEKGYTCIYNNYNNIPNSVASKKETITPILYYLGMRYEYNIGPITNKINVIVEGPSDANYLNAYLSQKKLYNKKINIIPSMGVDNIHNLVSIMIGWGCNFFVILDNDKQGQSEYKRITEKLCVSNDKISFTDGTNIFNQKANHKIEDIFSQNDKKNYIEKPDYDLYKNRYSIEFLNMIKKGQISMDSTTINNFDSIFSKIK